MYTLDLSIGTQPEYFGGLHGRADRPAVTCGDVSFTWSQLAERVHRLARAWCRLGLERNDVVGTFLKNRIEVVDIMFSMGRVGVTAATMNAKLTSPELAKAVRFVDSKAMIVDAALLSTFDEIRPQLTDIPDELVFVVGPTDRPHPYRAFDELFDVGDLEPIDREASEDDVWWIAFTGGTTGEPRACLVPQRGAVQLWINICIEVGITRDDVQIVSGSMNHAMGLLYGFASLYVGGTLVILPEFSGDAALRTIEKERVTFLPMAPALFTMVLESPHLHDYDVSSVRTALSAGAPLLTATKLRILDAFPGVKLWEAYGSTESGYITLLRPEDQLRKVRCAGQPVRDMRLRIVDDDGRDLPANQVGTIYKKGWLQGAVYYNDPEATAAQFLPGGWHTSGDMGYLDDEGYLFITDRKKNMIITGGVNVFPTEVEEMLCHHPRVVEAAVVGIPDERWGERVCAFVVARDGELTAEELDAYCRQQLAKFKIPRRFEFVTELPKTYAGKIRHRELRDRFWAGLDTVV